MSPAKLPAVLLISSLIFLSTIILITPAEGAEIHDACRAGDTDLICTLLDANPDLVNLADERGSQPLHFASDHGLVESVDLLLHRGADLGAVDVDGDTPLHWAAYRGRGAAIEVLLAAGAPIDAVNYELSTPLLYAAKRGQYDAVELLVQKGADLEIANDYGRTPLLYVTREGGDLEMARLLLQLGADVNTTDESGDTPLSLAAWRGFRALVHLYLERGATVDLPPGVRSQLFHNAVDRGLETLYRTLVDSGFEVSIAGNEWGSLLHAAAGGGSVEIVRDLIGRGVEIDGIDLYGRSPLHYAAVRGQVPVVEALLALHADQQLRSLSGLSALDMADAEEHHAVVELFRASGAEREGRQFPRLRGPYMGQQLPADGQAPFAPDIVTIPWGHHSSIAFSPDGKEAFWSAYEVPADSGYGYGSLQTSHMEDGFWTLPRRAPFVGARDGDVPFYLPGGDRLLFISEAPLVEGERGGKENIWEVRRKGDGWGEPKPLPPVINSMSLHWQFSVAANGNLYFSSRTGDAATEGLYLSRYVNGVYGIPEFQGIPLMAPCIAPDESYLLFSRFTPRGMHLLMTVPDGAGAWREPVDITEKSNGKISGMCPIVSPDGKYLFIINWSRNNTIYWHDTSFIEETLEGFQL